MVFWAKINFIYREGNPRKIKVNKLYYFIDKLRAFKKDKNSILQIYLDEKREADEKLYISLNIFRRLAQERFVRNQAFAKMASNDVKTIQGNEK